MGGDYYPARHALVEQNSDQEFVAWWEKMMVYNVIDNIFAKISLPAGAGIWFLLLLYADYSGKLWFYLPWGVSLTIGIISKFLGKWGFMEYYETGGADVIWRTYFFHSMWHLLSIPPTIVISYGLVAHGFPTPEWVSPT